jgi:glycosyltransferase involved in cell wall biosynthesis
MKLLVVSPFYKPAYEFGGPARSVPLLCEAMANLGVEVTVFTTNAQGDHSLPVEPNLPMMIDDVQVTYFERDILNRYFYSRKLAHACTQHAKDFDSIYIVSNWGYPLIPICRAAQKHTIPYIVSPRTAFMRTTWTGKYLKKMAYHQLVERSLINGAQALHYTSPLEMDESAWLRLKPVPWINPNPVDLSEIEHMPPRGTWRKARGIPDETRLILYLGRIEARKGIDLTLEAFAKIAHLEKDVVLVLAGPDEDNYVSLLQALCQEYELIDRVIFTGYLDSQTRLAALADADIFVLTSRAENFGVAVVEAMAAGIPVLVSNFVGLAPTIEGSKVGLVTSLDSDDIARKLMQLLASQDLRSAFGRQARIVANVNYSPTQVARTMLEYLERFSHNPK